MDFFMSENSTISDWEFDFTDHTDRRLITDISRTLTNMSSENRTKRRQMKLREDLVREHIEDKRRSKPIHLSIFRKLFK